MLDVKFTIALFCVDTDELSARLLGGSTPLISAYSCRVVFRVFGSFPGHWGSPELMVFLIYALIDLDLFCLTQHIRNAL